MKRTARFASVALALLFAGAVAAPAQEFPQGVPETFRVRLGGFFADLETTISSTPTGDPGLGREINYENDIGLPDASTAFRADATWRFAKHFAVDFGFVDFSRDGSRTLTREITLGDNTFVVGTGVEGTFDSTNIYGAFRWDPFKSENFELGFSLGVDYFDLSTSLTGGVRVNDVVVTRTTSATLEAPVPVIGAQLAWCFAPRFTVGGYIRFLAINVEEAEGSLTDASVRVDWYTWRNFGFGLSYDWSDLDLERLESAGYEYSFQYKYEGPRVFLIVSF
jgi:hypothetical protein